MSLKPIIIIDDDIDDIELFTEACALLNIKNEIKSFNNTTTAWQYLSTTQDHPFFILCDVNMPETNGLELRYNINQIEALRLKAMPFLIWSNSGQGSLVRQAYAIHIQGFFKKPDSMEELQNIISVITNYWNVSQHP